ELLPVDGGELLGHLPRRAREFLLRGRLRRHRQTERQSDANPTRGVTGGHQRLFFHFFSALPRNSNNALVDGSSALPRSALILLWVVSLAPNTVVGMPDSFRTLPRRCACALVSGCSATCRIRNGGIPLSLAACVTAEKSLCFAGSFPNFARWPNFAG